MALCVFIGDELSALGFRLAGVQCHSPPQGQALALFRELRELAQLILLTEEVAKTLPPDLLRRTQLAGYPLVLVIPDIQQRVLPPDRVAAVRKQLGMAQ